MSAQKTLHIFCLISSSLLAAPLTSDLPSTVAHLTNYTCATENSERADHQLWYQLATPVCRALTNPGTMQPYTSTPLLKKSTQKNIDLLTAFARSARSLPESIREAAAALAHHCRVARRIPGFEEQLFSAQAITDQMKRSKTHQQHHRLTSSEHKKRQRFLHEQHTRQRQADRQKRHEKTSAQRINNHAKTDSAREQKRYAEESRKLRKRKRDQMKAEKYAKQHRDNLVGQKTAEQQKQKQRIDLARQLLLNKKHR